MHIQSLWILDGRPKDASSPHVTPFERASVRIVEPYVAALGSAVKTRNIKRIQVWFYPIGHRKWIEYVGGYILEIGWPFDFGYWRPLTLGKRRRYLLDRFHTSMLWGARKMAWPTAPFIRSRQICIANHLEHRGTIFPKWIKHPNLPIEANLSFACDDRHFRASVTLRDMTTRILGSKPAIVDQVRYDQCDALVSHIAWTRNGKSIRLFPPCPDLWRGKCDIDVSAVVDRFASS
jgi:hypothetical protein